MLFKHPGGVYKPIKSIEVEQQCHFLRNVLIYFDDFNKKKKMTKEVT